MAEGIRKINEYVMQVGRTIIVIDDKLNIESFPTGTPLVKPNGDIKVKKDGQPDWCYFTPANVFENKSITYNFIADKTLTNQQISNNTILNDNIKDLEINTSKIANSAITTDKILDLNVTNVKLANNTIENDKLLDKTIQGNKIADNAIDHMHIKQNAVRDTHLQDNAVTETKISDRSVTANKIAEANVKTEHLQNGSVTTNKIGDLQVTTNKIGDSQVTASKIANANITTDKLGNLQVTTAKIGDLQVTNSKIANFTIETDKLVDNIITTKKISNGQVTSDKLSRALNDAINASIKLDSTGVANVNGSLYVKNNITAGGTISATKIYNAVYNDLAEGYIPGEHLKPGMIVEIREDGKVYKSSALSNAIVGVVSDEYAECYGATEEEIASGKKVAVGLIGKIHVDVLGPIKIGQKVVSIENGMGAASSGTCFNGVVGKAIESCQNNGINKVLCLIYPN